MSSEMKEQFNELISFVEKRTGLKFTEYPKYELYTLEGYRNYSVASYLDDFEEEKNDIILWNINKRFINNSKGKVIIKLWKFNQL